MQTVENRLPCIARVELHLLIPENNEIRCALLLVSSQTIHLMRQRFAIVNRGVRLTAVLLFRRYRSVPT